FRESIAERVSLLEIRTADSSPPKRFGMTFSLTVVANDQRRTTNGGFTQTVPKISHPPERTIANHRGRTSTSQFDLRPFQRQSRKFSLDRSRCASRTRRRSDPPCRTREFQSIRSACTGGTARLHGRVCRSRRR